MKRIILTALLGLTPAPVVAQSFDEAARSNFGVATYLCAQAMLGGGPAVASFQEAGFAYRPVDRGTNDFGIALGSDHFLHAPADTVRAEVENTDGHPGLCTVLTVHLDQAEVAPIVSDMLTQYFPGTQVRSGTEWIVQQAGQLPLIVNLSTIGTNHRYEPPGTVQLSMSFPG